MANEITNTQADVVIQELWRPKMLEARYPAMKVGRRVLSVDGDVKAKGDILHIPIEPTVSVNNVGSDGSVTNQALTPTEQQLTVDKWKECTIDVVDKAQRQSLIDLLTAFTPAFGKAMGSQFDTDLLALVHSGITTNVVGATAMPLDTINPDLLIAAVTKLLNLNVPVEDPNDIFFAFHPSCWGSLKKYKEFNDANITGKSVGGALTMEIPDIYGIPVVFSTNVTSQTATGDTYYENVLLHRQTLAWGMQKNFNIEQLARVKKSQPISGDALYGVKVVRENHGVVINAKN